MYAVIKTGGKQYRVTAGQKLKVERFAHEPNVGDMVELDQVLMLNNGTDTKIGNPLLPKVKVVAEVLAHGRGKKLKITKFKRRKHHEKTIGHRQNFTELKIVEIQA